MIVNPLPYESKLQTRPLHQIDLVVIHCTELPELADAREVGERIVHDSGTGNSGHYYVDRDGSTHRWVQPTCIAHHCRNYNERSIGIELINTGRYPDWLASGNQRMTEAYPFTQISALIALLHYLQLRIPTLRYIAGHEDMDRDAVPSSDDELLLVRRKRDPGPLFPWAKVLREVSLERLIP
jgi:N-acetylmuramoyl-L-alanine amidase